MSECVVCGAMPSRLHQRSVVVLVCEKHKDHGQPPSELDSLRSRLADAEEERDGLKRVLKQIQSVFGAMKKLVEWQPEGDETLAKLLVNGQAPVMVDEALNSLARPVTITRISHPESNARPATAKEDQHA